MIIDQFKMRFSRKGRQVRKGCWGDSEAIRCDLGDHCVSLFGPPFQIAALPPVPGVDRSAEPRQGRAALRSAFHQHLARPGARAAANHFAWLVVDKFVRLVFNVGVGFWVARALGPARFGLLAYAVAIISIGQIVAELGLEAVVRRQLLAAPADAAAIIVTAGLLRLGAAVIIAAGLLWWLPLGGEDAPSRSLLGVLALTLFQPALWITELWFQARLAARTSVAAQLAAIASGAAIRVGLILRDAPLVAFAWALVAEMMVAAVLLIALARRAGLRWGKFDRALAGRLLREAWPLLLSGLAVVLYLRIDALMLRHFVGEAAVGTYAAAVRFTEVWYFVPLALASSLLPALLRGKAQNAAAYTDRLQQFYDLNAALGYALALPTALTASWLIKLAYGAAYAGAGPVLLVHAWSLVFVFLGVARSQFLINEGFTRFYFCSTAAGLLLNAALNLVLIPRYGAWGAALATLASQTVAAWLSSFCFAPVRATAWMQTRALLIPVRWFSYVRRA